MSAAEESTMRRQRRRMGGAQHAVPARIDDPALLLRIAAPQQEYQPFALTVEHFDDVVGESFPALALMRPGTPLLNGQYRIEQQHAPTRPRHQIAMVRWRDAQVALDFLVDVLQR